MFTYDEEIYSDLHKDAYGFRPREDEFYSATPERKQEIWDWTLDALDFAIAEEARLALRAQREWEGRIQKLQELGAPDEATAIRWDVEAHEIEAGDPHRDGYYCFTLGLAYMHEHRIAAAFK